MFTPADINAHLCELLRRLQIKAIFIYERIPVGEHDIRQSFQKSLMVVTLIDEKKIKQKTLCRAGLEPFTPKTLGPLANHCATPLSCIWAGTDRVSLRSAKL